MPRWNANQEAHVHDNVVQLNNANSAINPSILSRTNFNTNSGDLFNIPIIPQNWWVHDDFDTALPTSAAGNDDLALIQGAYGTNAMTLTSNDFGDTTTSQKARCVWPLPAEYVAGGTLGLTIYAGMLTAVASTSATLDVQVYAWDTDGTVSSDLYTGAATSINNLTISSYDFSLTASGRTPGENLDIVLTFAGNDTGTAVCAGTICRVDLTANTK